MSMLAIFDPGPDGWEYAVAESDGTTRGRFDGPRDRASVEAWWAEQRDLQNRGCYLVRRRPASAWAPVPADGEESQ